MENFSFTELFKSPYMYVGLVVGFLLCKMTSKRKY